MSLKIFLKLLSEKFKKYQERKRHTKTQKLLRHIEKQFQIIEKTGTETRKLAQSILTTVGRYQNSLSSPLESMRQNQKKVLQKQAASKIDSKMLQSLNPKEVLADYQPSQQELDAFRMKGITLMKLKGMLPEFISEALQSPIKVNVEMNQGEGGHVKIEFSQRFERLGEEFELRGTFLKTITKKITYSIPISGSFQLSQSSKFVPNKGSE